MLLKTLEAHTPLKYNHTMEVISITEKIVSVMDVSEEEKKHYYASSNLSQYRLVRVF